MHPKTILLFGIMILCAGCNGNNAGVTITPDFFTATLPPIPTQQATQTPVTPEPILTVVEEINISPIEGMTTTQLNVRAEPSTASASLGLVGIFAKVQVIGKDASGSWYQIMYTESQTGKGWVRAEFVQVESGAEIRQVEIESGPGSKVNGMVTQRVNVRSGPGLESELLGVLNSNDLVFITGREPGGKWIQIEFAGAPDGKGWVTAEFLQADNLDSVPMVDGKVAETSTPTVATPAMDSTVKTAFQDGDSMQSPLTKASLSPMTSRALQVNGDVSAPDGDAEDWIQFTSQSSAVSIQVTCPNNALSVELWNNGKSMGDFPCGETSVATVQPGDNYFLRLLQNGTGYTMYVLQLKIVP
ncbi:hypothetical protein ANAEL_03987 [Anaerolineales bacterium]|nr:hypothetical protein ANAEL_03987 [Anaerolineales bacterium]